ncbi:MAG: hypothetical protein NTV93_19340 [Verrucomicrobia bacterium]|nr:hypothetical protein [Verrucomicrobiota bacterium]
MRDEKLPAKTDAKKIGHPDADYYNNAYAYRLEKHNSKWKRLLGYGYVNRPEGDSYRKLSDLVKPALFPAPDTYHLDLWVKAK